MLIFHLCNFEQLTSHLIFEIGLIFNALYKYTPLMDKLSKKPDVYFGEQLGLTIEEVLFEDVMIHDLTDKGKLVDDSHS